MFKPEEYDKILKTQKLGKNCISFKQVDSTNAYAVNNQVAPFSVVVSETQTAGRGRSGRKWESDSGDNLYFSIVLPVEDPAKLLPLNIIMAYALADSLKNRCSLKVKWPNDIIADGKKMAGILLETSISGAKVEKLVIGVGLNVNSTEFPDGIKEMATSLKMQTGSDFSKEEVLADIMKELEKYWDDLDGYIKKMPDMWKNYSAFLDKKIAVHKDGVKTYYLERGLSGSGCLFVEDENGTVSELVTGDIGYDFSS